MLKNIHMRKPIVKISLFHLDPAKINRRQNSTAQVGGYAALVCASDGNPIPDITWTRDKTDEIVGSGIALGFCSAQFQDAGWYTCSSKNSLGQDRASVYLEVTGKNDNPRSDLKVYQIEPK